MSDASRILTDTVMSANWHSMHPEVDAKLVEVVRRVERALGAWLDLDDCIALTLLLQYHRFAYPDGFAIAEDCGEDDTVSLGPIDAARVAQCFVRQPARRFPFFGRRRVDAGRLHVLGAERSDHAMWRRVEELRDAILATDGARLMTDD